MGLIGFSNQLMIFILQRVLLKGEVEVARRKLANQQSRTAMEKVKHEEMLIEEEHLFHKAGC